MKQLISLIFLSFLFINCGQEQGNNTITTVELKVLLSKEKIQLVDVRTPKEIEQGSIKTALFVNYFDEDFAIKLTSILDKNKPVYLYCRSGNRSGKAVKKMEAAGFTKAHNMTGGWSTWSAEVESKK